MVGLWLWAATDNVAGGRHLARLCEGHLAYKWMCGGLPVNYHSLNDFRTGHQAALDGLFTATLGRLTHAGLVEVTRITQDGLRVRASAGAGSFHRRPTLEQCLAEAERHLAELRARQDEEAGADARRAAAGLAAAEDRADQVRMALAEMTEQQQQQQAAVTAAEPAVAADQPDPVRAAQAGMAQPNEDAAAGSTAATPTAEAAVDARRAAAELAAAEGRVGRVQAALAEMTKLEAARAKQTNKAKRENPPRVSTTDPEARVMKMPNGGFNPAYNVQLATDPVSRAIVGVSVSNCGSDAPLSEPMRAQVQERTGGTVAEHLVDGGYMSLDVIDRATAAGVALFMPVPEPNKNAKDADRFARRPGDSDAVAAWRARMATEAAQRIYLERAATSETANADLRTCRGMSPFKVRGLAKVTSVALWSAMAYNLLHFAAALT